MTKFDYRCSLSAIMRAGTKNFKRGVTLTELLCVLAIIGILLAMYLPTISRAFARVKHFLANF